METIKVKRSPESKGRCKLAWNKVYTAYKYDNTSKYELGKQFYPASWFTIVTDNQPKSKPVVTTDPKTGKLKVERDWSKPQAFPEYYQAPIGTKLIAITNGGYTHHVCVAGDNCVVVAHDKIAPHGVRVEFENRNRSMFTNSTWFFQNINLAPLNPTDHPEHPDFGKAKNELKTIKGTPEPTDIRDTIAEYVRKYGHELTAIELIGHLTIDKQ